MSVSNQSNTLMSGNCVPSVIECPSCSTRFAIDAQQVTNIQEPLFHCSRCGHYFGIKHKAVEAAVEVNDIQEVSTLHAEQLNLMPEEINPEPDFTAETALSNHNWYKKASLDFCDDADEDIKYKVQWPSENKFAVEIKKTATVKKTSYFIEPESNYYLDLSELEDGLDEDVDNVYLPRAKGLTQKKIFDRFFKSSKTIPSLEAATDTDQNKYVKVDDFIESEDRSVIRTALIIMSFPIVFAGFLAYWGLNIDQTPAILMSLFNMDSKLLATVAPSGLALSALSPEIITLESGERAFRIKGDVINSTGNTFSSLTLEAKLFTKDNRELVRVIAPLDNALRDADNISALNSDSIERLQGESSEEVTTIQPNFKVPFSLVVPGIKGEEAWYSARIYSVIRM